MAFFDVRTGSHIKVLRNIMSFLQSQSDIMTCNAWHDWLRLRHQVSCLNATRKCRTHFMLFDQCQHSASLDCWHKKFLCLRHSTQKYFAELIVTTLRFFCYKVIKFVVTCRNIVATWHKVCHTCATILTMCVTLCKMFHTVLQHDVTCVQQCVTCQWHVKHVCKHVTWHVAHAKRCVAI